MVNTRVKVICSSDLNMKQLEPPLQERLVYRGNLSSRSIPSIRIHPPYIRLRQREPGLLGNRVRGWAGTSLSSGQFFALGRRAAYSCSRPSFWLGLGSAVGGLAGSRLRADFGTCDREGLKNEKKWRKVWRKEEKSEKKKRKKLQEAEDWRVP